MPSLDLFFMYNKQFVANFMFRDVKLNLHNCAIFSIVSVPTFPPSPLLHDPLILLLFFISVLALKGYVFMSFKF